MLPSPIDLELQGDGCWPDLEPDRFRDLTGTPLKLAVLDKGTASGQPVVTLRIDPPPASEAGGGSTPIVMQVTARQFLLAAALISARWPHLMEET